MKTRPTLNSISQVKRFAIGCTAVLAACSPQFARSQGTLAYSFEDGLQGFAANGSLILPLTQDTIGATEGTQSLKMELLQNATYVGALAGDLDQSIFGNPPGIISISFDLTIPTAFPEEGFVEIFPVFFAIQQGTTEPGYEISFQDTNTLVDSKSRIPVGDLAPGTHPITMVLENAYHPLDFEDFSARPYNEIFGDGSNPIDMIATGFQITVNKSTQAGWVAYIDNIRFSSTAGTPGDFDGDGDVDGRDFLVWQRGGSPAPLSSDDLTSWQTNYGVGGLSASFASVPEPTSGLMVFAAVGCFFTTRRRR